MFRRMLKWGGWILLALLLLAAGLLALGLAINARDEPPSAQARALSVVPSNPYGNEENLYYAMAGLDAPTGASVNVAGAARIAAEVAALDPQLPTVRPARTPPPMAQALTFSGTMDLCNPSERACSLYAPAPGKEAAVRKLLSDNAELYGRYRALRGMRGYFETVPPSATLIAHFPEPSLRKLFQADVALRMRSGKAGEVRAALAELNADMALWRLLLRGHGPLLGKMVALAYLQADLLLLGDIVADPQAQLPTGAADTVAQLWAPADWDIADGFAWEFRMQAAMVRELHSSAAAEYLHSLQAEPEGWFTSRLSRLNNWLGLQFLKPQATENRFAYLMTRFMQAAPPDGSSVVRLPQVPVEEGYDPSKPWNIWLSYNPIGKILVAIAAPAYRSYVLRATDVAALQRLVRLGYEMRDQKVAAGAMCAFMQAHPEWATHPGDGHAFVLHEESGEIDIVPLNASTDRRYFVRTWRPPGANP
jgi:hypothetical protein